MLYLVRACCTLLGHMYRILLCIVLGRDMYSIKFDQLWSKDNNLTYHGVITQIRNDCIDREHATVVCATGREGAQDQSPRLECVGICICAWLFQEGQ